MENRIGVLRPGNYADIVLLNRDLDVQTVIKRGRIAVPFPGLG
jgi:N-acetylglucosamine-6-phosphate deacetylase